MDVNIRAMTLEDAPRVGEVHVRAWQATYRSVMPDDYLDGLRAEDRADMWRRGLALERPGTHLDVIDVDGVVAGFASYGVERGTVDDPTVGELIAINIHPEHWRHGLGRLLLRHVTAQLAGLGFGAAVLWVVAENVRARAFYEAESWRFDGTTRVDTVQGATVNEVRFARDLPRPNGLDQR